MMRLIGRLSRILQGATRKKPALASIQSNSQALQAALAHHQANHLEEAETIYRQILAADKENPDVLHLLGVIAQQRGNSEQAVKLISRSVAINPAQPVALNNLAGVYRALMLLENAETATRQALILKPDYAEAHNGLGITFQLRGQRSAAEQCFRAALAHRPDYTEALTNLGNVLLELGRVDEAVAYHQHAVELNPQVAGAFYNLGMALKEQGKLADAENCYRKALALWPRHAQAYNNLGALLEERGDLGSARKCYEKALDLDPHDPTFAWNLAIVALLHGDYETGLDLHEQRFTHFQENASGTAALHERLKGHQRWTGGSIEGRRLLVWTEQGLGDSIMITRYLSLLDTFGPAQVALYCEPALVRLLRGLPGIGPVISKGDAPSLPNFDLHCPMMSLPYLFKTRVDSIPNQVPYLHVSEPLGAHWSEKLAAHFEATGQDERINEAHSATNAAYSFPNSKSKMRVGLAWSGNKALRHDAQRSIPLLQFEPLLGISGIQLVCLQKGPEATQLSRLGWHIPDWMDECHDFLDTAALIQNLDLVISVDTAVAHLAGALGKPVWLLNRFESEWRWGLEREDSPWYPTMRIFRQIQPGNWDAVILRVAAELEKSAEQP